MGMEQRYQQAAAVLPPVLREQALSLPDWEQEQAEEFRLRVGQRMTVVLPEGERPVGREAVKGEDLERLLELASRASVHAVLGQLREGFLTVEGGHRIGLCGTVVMRDGEVQAIRDLSSASLRVAREVVGAAAPVLDRLCPGGILTSTLILAPPGLGKTTLLRDLIRTVSEGEGCRALRVAVADERGELAALCRGRPQWDVGRRTDVLQGCPKDRGLLMLLRSMSPQVLAVDEVTAPADVQALQLADGCGVILLATAHGAALEDLYRRPVYRPLLKGGLFRRVVLIRRVNGERSYLVKELE